MLGKAEGKMRRGQQRMYWLDSSTDSMDMNSSKFWEIGKDRKPGVLQSMGSKRVRHDLVTKQQQPEQTVFQRLYTDGQKAHEKMLSNITNHQRNGNQNHKMSHHTHQNAYHQKSQITN